MEDEQQRQMQLHLTLHRRLEKVTPELFSEFLFDRGVWVVKCLMCGSEDLTVPNSSVMTVGQNGSESSTYIVPIKLDTDGPPNSIMKYEYRLICKNCAFSMHYAVWPVLEWLEKKVSGSGAGADE